MIRVLIIEDDPMVQEVNRQFIEMVQGFSVVGMASNGVDGLKKIEKLQPDLVLMDVYMPSLDGLKTIRRMKEDGLKAEVIAITAADDIETVKTFLQHGAFDYIMKPFRFERFKKALEKYKMYDQKMRHSSSKISQAELDEFLYQQQEDKGRELPKGFNPLTLEKIILLLMEKRVGLSADEVAEIVGIARVTARRYLDYLEKDKKVDLDNEYKGVGRPINRYKYKD